MLIWTLTAVVAVVVLATPLRLHRESGRSGIRIGRTVSRIHTVAGLVGVAAWAALVQWGEDVVLGDALMGVIALAGFWVTTFSGLLIMLRWLPTPGDHDRCSWRDRFTGPIPSVVGHLAVLAITVYFCWAYVSFTV